MTTRDDMGRGRTCKIQSHRTLRSRRRETTLHRVASDLRDSSYRQTMSNCVVLTVRATPACVIVVVWDHRSY